MFNFFRFSQPTFYVGYSFTKLLLHNLAKTFSILKRRGPSRRVLKNLKRLKNSKAGKIALVLGNGPSLSKIDLNNLTLVKPEIFAVNDYYLKIVAQTVVPNYYCLSDPDNFIQPNRTTRHNNSQLLKYIENNFCTVLIPHFYRKFDFGSKKHIVFYNDREFYFSKNTTNPCRPRGYSSLTVLKALSIALYMGYDKIFILGIDNTEHRALHGDLENNHWLEADKLYEDHNIVNVEIPVYSESGIAGKFQQYATWFSDFHKFPKEKIFNLDPTSLIDAFAKVEKISK